MPLAGAPRGLPPPPRCVSVNPDSSHRHRPAIATLAQLEWSPGIGDPHFTGWFTAVAYLVCAGLCGVAARRGEFESPVLRQRALWWMLTSLMLFLGVNKQLDLQSLLTEVGRLLALQQGWYEERREVQRIFVLAIACGTGGGVMVMLLLYRAVLPAHRVAIVGVLLLAVFVVMRASAFHHVGESLLPRSGARWGSAALELLGISLVAWNARQLVRRRPTSQ